MNKNGMFRKSFKKEFLMMSQENQIVIERSEASSSSSAYLEVSDQEDENRLDIPKSQIQSKWN
jgi:hypothetical protein